VEAREVGFLSGACLAIPRRTWEATGGFPDAFFLYHEDVDLSLRLRLGGARLGIEPAARVDHSYEFAKGPQKWLYLERNRWATVIRTYPLGLIVLLAPALLATELALLVVSASGGWGAQKLRAYTQVLRWLPRLMRERRAIQASRRVSATEFAAWMTADLSSPYLGRLSRFRALGAVLRAYWSLVRTLLAATPTSPSSSSD
jgi:GT2 family glycosyltransferase